MEIVGSEQDGQSQSSLGRSSDQDRAENERLERATRTGVELVQGIRAEPDEKRSGDRPRSRKTPERDRDELEHTGRRAAAQVRAEAAFGTAPEVVGDTDERDRSDARHGGADQQAHEGQSQTAEVDALRPAGGGDLGQLPAAMREAAQIA